MSAPTPSPRPQRPRYPDLEVQIRLYDDANDIIRMVGAKMDDRNVYPSNITMFKQECRDAMRGHQGEVARRQHVMKVVHRWVKVV